MQPPLSIRRIQRKLRLTMNVMMITLQKKNIIVLNKPTVLLNVSFWANSNLQIYLRWRVGCLSLGFEPVTTIVEIAFVKISWRCFLAMHVAMCIHPPTQVCIQAQSAFIQGQSSKVATYIYIFKNVNNTLYRTVPKTKSFLTPTGSSVTHTFPSLPVKSHHYVSCLVFSSRNVNTVF